MYTYKHTRIQIYMKPVHMQCHEFRTSTHYRKMYLQEIAESGFLPQLKLGNIFNTLFEQTNTHAHKIIMSFSPQEIILSLFKKSQTGKHLTLL